MRRKPVSHRAQAAGRPSVAGAVVVSHAGRHPCPRSRQPRRQHPAAARAAGRCGRCRRRPALSRQGRDHVGRRLSRRLPRVAPAGGSARSGDHVGLLAPRDARRMSDAHTVVVLGATSAIAQAYARRRATGNKFVLLARREDRLAGVAGDLLARGAAPGESVVMDLSAIGKIERAVESIRARFGPAREIVVAYGTLGEQAALERALDAAKTALDVNFTSAALWLLAFLKRREAARSLTCVVIGSVAGGCR